MPLAYPKHWGYTKGMTTGAEMQDALARLDEGVGRVGDRELAERYETLCQAGDLHLRVKAERAERDAWAVSQCPGCESGGTGELCDEHREETTWEKIKAWASGLRTR